MLILHELPLSPNNLKIRMALNYKGIPFEVAPVDHRDRTPLVELSGQDGTPIVEDRGIVLPDSETILHYLDANYRDRPRLWPENRTERWNCEQWRKQLQERLLPPWSAIFFHTLRMRDTLEDGAHERFAEALGWLDGELGEGHDFKGSDRPICDLWVAAWVAYAFPGEALLARVGFFKKLGKAFAMDAKDFPNLVRFLQPWLERAG